MSNRRATVFEMCPPKSKARKPFLELFGPPTLRVGALQLGVEPEFPTHTAGDGCWMRTGILPGTGPWLVTNKAAVAQTWPSCPPLPQIGRHEEKGQLRRESWR